MFAFILKIIRENQSSNQRPYITNCSIYHIVQSIFDEFKCFFELLCGCVSGEFDRLWFVLSSVLRTHFLLLDIIMFVNQTAIPNYKRFSMDLAYNICMTFHVPPKYIDQYIVYLMCLIEFRSHEHKSHSKARTHFIFINPLSPD